MSTTPVIDGCSRGQEAPSSGQQNAVAPPSSGEAPAPAEAPSVQPPPPPANPVSAPPSAPPPGEAAAPSGPPPQLATAEQLQQLVSPIALYPDMLVGQILTGSTFPNQVTEANQFMEQHPGLTGDALAAQVNPKPWDPSIRSLCQFPSVLHTMSQSISWTTALGNAYYTQPQDVLNAIQVMRRRAMQAGNLKSTSQQRVVIENAPPAGGAMVAQGGQQPQVIVIQPSQPNTVFVPSYNPSTVYGQPVPQPAGYSGMEMLAAGVVGFGAGVLMGSLINHGSNNWGTNWYGGTVVYNRTVYVPPSPYFAARYPGYQPYAGYRPGYPGYPGHPGYPGYPGYPGHPGYPAYPGARPGYPGYAGTRPAYPANRPGYPAGYPPRAPYASRPPNLAATNPNVKPKFPNPAAYPNRPGTNYGTNRPGTKPETYKPGTYKPGQTGRPSGSNLAATKPTGPITKPANNMMPSKHFGGTANRGGHNLEANRIKPRTGGANKPGGSAKGAGAAGNHRPHKK